MVLEVLHRNCNSGTQNAPAMQSMDEMREYSSHLGQSASVMGAGYVWVVGLLLKECVLTAGAFTLFVDRKGTTIRQQAVAAGGRQAEKGTKKGARKGAKLKVRNRKCETESAKLSKSRTHPRNCTRTVSSLSTRARYANTPPQG